MAGVRFRAAARKDLVDIAAYIAEDSEVRSMSFRDELVSRCESLARPPLRGRSVLQHGPDVRQLVHGNYLILFRQDRVLDEIVILRVVHGSRDLSKLRIGS